MKKKYSLIVLCLFILGIGASAFAKDKKSQQSRIVSVPATTVVEATLLHGVVVGFKSNEQGSVKPMLFQIDDPSKLFTQNMPNIKGCFVTVKGTFNAANGRMDARLSALSLTTTEGEGAVNQRVTGYVVDKKDNLVGLAADGTTNNANNFPVITFDFQKKAKLIFTQGVDLEIKEVQ